MPHVSPSSKEVAESYRLRQSDVVVLSFPKTGTTWTQTVCEQLRTNAEGYEGFEDITQRQPWLDFAYDCGQDLNSEMYGLPCQLPSQPLHQQERHPSPQERHPSPEENQDVTEDDPNTIVITKLKASYFPPRGPLLSPRIFKSHQLLSAINPGAKYLCIVRDPAATLLSWFDFQKAKGRLGYTEYEDVNEHIAKQPELFSGNNIFGTNLWEMYAEMWSARNDPSVKILVYEALIADASSHYMDHLPIIASFLGRNEEEDVQTRKLFYEKVAALVSREEMMKHVDRFDDHFIAEMGKKIRSRSQDYGARSQSSQQSWSNSSIRSYPRMARRSMARENDSLDRSFDLRRVCYGSVRTVVWREHRQ